MRQKNHVPGRKAPLFYPALSVDAFLSKKGSIMKQSIFAGVLVITAFGAVAQRGGQDMNFASGEFSLGMNGQTMTRAGMEAQSDISRAQVMGERDAAVANHSIATGELPIRMLEQPGPGSAESRSEVKQDAMSLIRSGKFPASGDFSAPDDRGDFSQ